jgi:hypothetical protein
MMFRKTLLAVLAVLVLATPHPRAASTYFVGISNCSDSGPGTKAQPFCTLSKAAAVSASGDTVNVQPGVYRGAVTESTPSVTWVGTGASPMGVQVTQSVSRTAQGWTVTKTAGLSNVWQFSPGGQVAGIFELNARTDLWRRYPAFDAANSEENGTDPYVAWHTKAAGGGGVSAAAQDYFGDRFCAAPNECEPPTLQDCMSIVDTVPGSWCQDDADYSGTWKVYFHPRTQRVNGVVKARAGSAFDLEVCLSAGLAGDTGSFLKDGTKLSRMSFYGCYPGQDGNAGVPGVNALRIGGDNSEVFNLITHGSNAWVTATWGATNFYLHDSLFVAGLKSSANNGAFAGIRLENLEALGDQAPFNWTGPWGTPESPMVIRRLIGHEGTTYRRPGYYNYATDIYRQFPEGEGIPGLPTTPLGTHPTSVGSNFRAPRHVIIENSVLLATMDSALRLYNCTAGCMVRNTFLRVGAIDSWAARDLLQPGSMTLVNSIVLGRFRCGLVNCAEYVTRDYNLYLENHSTATGGAVVLARDVAGTYFTLAQMQARGYDAHSTGLNRSVADAGQVFADFSFSTGADVTGEDYRLIGGSPAINKGSNTHCAHAAVGVCDLGPYEFGAALLTGPAVRPFGEILQVAAPPPPPPPPPPSPPPPPATGWSASPTALAFAASAPGTKTLSISAPAGLKWTLSANDAITQIVSMVSPGCQPTQVSSSAGPLPALACTGSVVVTLTPKSGMASAAGFTSSALRAKANTYPIIIIPISVGP